MPKLPKKMLSVFMMALVLLTAALFFGVVRDYGVCRNIINLNKDWTISFRDSVYQVDDISEFKVPFRVCARDTLILENKIPVTLPEHPELRFRTYHSAVDIDIDGPVYSYGYDKLERGEFVGSGIHYSVLDPAKAGRPIRVRVVASKDDAFSVFPYLEILPVEKSLSDYNARHLLETFIGFFLVLFGIISILASFVMKFWGSQSYRFVLIGFLSLFLGLWTLCYMKVIQIFSMDFTFNTVLEFFTLYLTPIPFGLLLLDMCKDAEAWKVRTLEVLVSIATAFVVVCALLHGLGIVYCSELLGFFHLFILVVFLFLVAHILPYKKSADLSNRILTWGVAIFGAVAVVDLLRYNAYRIFSVRSFLLETTLIPVGILIFVMLLMASYLIYLKGFVEAKAEKDVLSTLVYRDSLTGLFNRAKCDQIFEVLDKSDYDYAIVSIDMNGLKVVNDKYGHNIGDKLIQSFADVFREAFAGLGTAIRMGGDEFVAVVRHEHLGEVRIALNKLNRLMTKRKGTLPVPLEAAYGVAYRKESGAADANAVYAAADKKMYDMKMSMKSNLVRR